MRYLLRNSELWDIQHYPFTPGTVWWPLLSIQPLLFISSYWNWSSKHLNMIDHHPSLTPTPGCPSNHWDASVGYRPSSKLKLCPCWTNSLYSPIPLSVPTFENTRDSRTWSHGCTYSTGHISKVRPFCRMCQTPFPSEPCDAVIQWLPFAPLAQQAVNSAAMIANAQTAYISVLNYFEDSGNPEMNLLVILIMLVSSMQFSHNSCSTVCLVTHTEATIISSPPRDLFWFLFPFRLWLIMLSSLCVIGHLFISSKEMLGQLLCLSFNCVDFSVVGL